MLADSGGVSVKVMTLNLGHRLILVISLFTLFLLSISSSAFAKCYTYDSLGRLIAVDYDNAGTAQRTYSLDEHGNRTNVQDVTSGGTACVVPLGTPSTGNSDPAGPAQNGGSGGTTPPPTNSPPVTDDEIITLEVSSTMLVNPLEGDTDPDGDTLTLTGVSTSSTLFTFTLSGTAVTVSSGSVAGSGAIDYMASDGNGGTAGGTIFVTITAPNVIPPFVDICNQYPIPAWCLY